MHSKNLTFIPVSLEAVKLRCPQWNKITLLQKSHLEAAECQNVPKLKLFLLQLAK